MSRTYSGLVQAWGPSPSGGGRGQKKKKAPILPSARIKKKKEKRSTLDLLVVSKKKNNPQWHSALPRCSAMLLTSWSSLSCFLLLSVSHIATFGSKRAAATPPHAVDRVGSLGALLDCGDPKKNTREMHSLLRRLTVGNGRTRFSTSLRSSTRCSRWTEGLLRGFLVGFCVALLFSF